MPTIAEALANRRFDSELRVKMSGLGLPDFETRADCEKRQAEMCRRLDKVGDDPVLIAGLGRCGTNTCGLDDDCVEGCHFATLNRRMTSLASAIPLFEHHPGPVTKVTIVHPAWEAKVGQLQLVKMAGARQWNARRLKSLALPGLMALGIFEVTVNRNLDGETYWAGEIQQVVAGASHEQLRHAFLIESRDRNKRPRQRMVHVEAVESLPRSLAYAQKRLVQERRQFFSDIKRRHDRRHLPPKPEHWAEFDAWLLSLPLGARNVLFGCSRKGNTVFNAIQKEDGNED